ncbi:helix-turn-helix domain-containing protein [Myxacorys almedinensis]|uniref:Nucleotide exchange factor GrpE n=1 Tax=Myxacorys almedinensis A TaxID=2690445 RepID=A0A8J7YWR4_9CYAN|nr:helix-turn-helix domain-containing protein [Myxacorys almedinensis]NDJ16057.1 nucleotide exchange factor GrpE [Myxacorys almedinensis A]
MNPPTTHDYTPQLRRLMQERGISSFRQLSQQAQVSQTQVRYLRSGQIGQMRLESLVKLGETLGVAIADLLPMFSRQPLIEPNSSSITSEIAQLQHEYQRLQNRLEHQKEELWKEFQQSALQTLEPWLLQWSAAAYAAQQNPQAPAVKLLPLVRPIEQLLQQWEIEATAIVGTEIPYDPHYHQLMGGTANAGDLVRVRYAGYKQGDRLLYRTKVSPTN